MRPAVTLWCDMRTALGAVAAGRGQFDRAVRLWEQAAKRWGRPVGAQPDSDPTVTPAVAPGPPPAAGRGGAVLAAAQRQLGRPYVWGGGDRNGPTGGGFDCSGLALYAWWQGAQVNLEHSTASQSAAGARIPPEQVRAGDLLVFNTTGPLGTSASPTAEAAWCTRRTPATSCGWCPTCSPTPTTPPGSPVRG